MTLLMSLSLIFGTVLAIANQPVRSNEPIDTSNVEPKASQLALSISSDKQRYKRQGKIKITVALTNVNYGKDIFIYGNLGWGYSASLTYIIRDAAGKRIQPNILADDLTFPLSRDDTSSFVKLLPGHFLGTYYVETLARLNLGKPGKYGIFVEYHCPISSTDVKLSNFWGKENGTIRSNVVYVEVLR